MGNFKKNPKVRYVEHSFFLSQELILFLTSLSEFKKIKDPLEGKKNKREKERHLRG